MVTSSFRTGTAKCDIYECVPYGIVITRCMYKQSKGQREVNLFPVPKIKTKLVDTPYVLCLPFKKNNKEDNIC